MSTTVKLFTELGLTLNMAKSVLIPSQFITFLGFVLNSVQMTVSLTPSKAMKVKSKAVELLHNQSPTIRTVSEMIGFMVGWGNAWTPLLQTTRNRKGSCSETKQRQFLSKHDSLRHGKI